MHSESFEDTSNLALYPSITQYFPPNSLLHCPFNIQQGVDSSKRVQNRLAMEVKLVPILPQEVAMDLPGMSLLLLLGRADAT